MGYTLWIWLSAVLVSIVVYCMVTPCLGSTDGSWPKLLVTSATLVVTGALLVVTMFAIDLV